MPRETDSRPLHEQLLDDPADLAARYDRSAREFIEVGRAEGHYDGWDAGDVRWPDLSEGDRVEVLSRRVKLVRALADGIPQRRAERLGEAYDAMKSFEPAYRSASKAYEAIKRSFIDQGEPPDSLLSLYQNLYLEAIASGDLFSHDSGEAALAQAQITHVPLSHAQAVAEALSALASEDPRWDTEVAYPWDDEPRVTTLREALGDVARATLDYIAAGGLLATRYNTYTNFAWFGCAIWMVALEAELVLARLAAVGKMGPIVRKIDASMPLAQAYMIEFVQAHQEDPNKLRPKSYWYGQPYSYLTRDMIDGATRLVSLLNPIARRHLGAGAVIEIPGILTGEAAGAFTEYATAGARESGRGGGRAMRLAKWAQMSYSWGRGKVALERALDRGNATEEETVVRAWKAATDWGTASIEALGVEVDVTIDPHFEEMAAGLGVSEAGRRLAFMPTHQSLLDHPVMYHTLQRPELTSAMGWDDPHPCAILARRGLGRHGVRIGGWSITMFGLSSDRFDALQEKVDGYVMLDRADTEHTTTRLSVALDGRPGVVYPMGTTAAFALQNFPVQHALFAYLPQDVVIIPMAFRGIHSVWPKCPKGNLKISPGRVEVYVCPPVSGETTMLPRRRSLRVQAETAALLQAIHIGALFDPEGRTAA